MPTKPLLRSLAGTLANIQEMKHYRLIGILGLIFFVAGCTKTIFDKRRKYLGDYEFTINITCTPNLGNCDTSYTYDANQTMLNHI